MHCQWVKSGFHRYFAGFAGFCPILSTKGANCGGNEAYVRSTLFVGIMRSRRVDGQLRPRESPGFTGCGKTRNLAFRRERGVSTPRIRPRESAGFSPGPSVRSAEPCFFRSLFSPGPSLIQVRIHAHLGDARHQERSTGIGQRSRQRGVEEVDDGGGEGEAGGDLL